MEIDVYERRPAPRRAAGSGLAFRFEAGAPDPWTGPYARLFAHVAQACGAERGAVRVERGQRTPATGLAIAFGDGPGDPAGGVRSERPEALAASAAAKRALWDAIRARRRS